MLEFTCQDGVVRIKGDENFENFSDDEIVIGTFARQTGFNKGLGGSMHAFFIPFGLMPNNAIVGGSAPIALGAALYKRANHKPGITTTKLFCYSTSDKFVYNYIRTISANINCVIKNISK